MVKPLQRGEIKSFSGGLNTEAPLLQFPDNASQSELNFDMALDGTRFRRLGFDIEKDGIYIDSLHEWDTVDEKAHNTYLWEQVSGVAGKQFLVVQLGNSLYFFDPAAEVISTIGLRYLEMTGSDPTVQFGFASIEGFLIVVSGNGVINIVEYDRVTDEMAVTSDRIKIRDLFGVQELGFPRYEDENDFRGDLDSYHYWNLYNQGWAIPRYNWANDPILIDAAALGSGEGTAPFPSNGDTVWLGIQERPTHKDGDNWLTAECFHHKQYVGIRGSSEPASRGFFIIDAFNRGQSRLEQWELHKGKYPPAGNLPIGAFTLLQDQTLGGPTIVADHAGRVFYSGCSGQVIDGDKRSPNYTNYIFFSQLVKNRRDLVNCYQVGDPTSRESSDVVDTDGGFLKISEARNIVGMFSLGARLIVLAENGVWSVTGGNDYGFSATNYRVDKLSTYGAAGHRSVIVEGSNAYYWGVDAIYKIGPNQLGDQTVEDITTGTIKTFYGKIARQAKEKAFGSYNPFSRRISWIYHDSALDYSSGVPNQELVFDLNLGSFIPFEIQTFPRVVPFIIGTFTSPSYTVREEESSIIVSTGEEVATSNGDVLGGSIQIRVPTVNNVRYAIFGRNDADHITMSFGHYWKTDFMDWASIDGIGVDAPAHILTGDTTTGDAAIKKQTPYLVMFFENTDKELDGVESSTPSSCIGRVQWEFTDTVYSGRWTRDMQFYRPVKYRYTDGLDIYTGHKLLITKNKIRGNGRAFALHLRTEPGKDCRIVGWNFTMTANGVT